MGYVRIKPRKWPEGQNENARQEFKERIDILRNDNSVDLWFSDESGFAGDPMPRYIMAKKGSRIHLPYFGSHIRSNVIGAVRVNDGKFFSLIMPYVNTELFQLFIDELNKHINHEKTNVLILDNASWHKTKGLNWRNIHPLFLPPYSPDLNPIEQLWLAIKKQDFTWFWTKDHKQLDDHLQKSLKYFIDNPAEVKSICSMSNFR
jgi:transposase